MRRSVWVAMGAVAGTLVLLVSAFRLGESDGRTDAVRAALGSVERECGKAPARSGDAAVEACDAVIAAFYRVAPEGAELVFDEGAPVGRTWHANNAGL